jgi:hypothetical protein
MKKAVCAGIIVSLSVFLFAAVSCDNGNGPKKDVPRVITLLSPKGGAGEKDTVGRTLLISWTVHNDNPDSAKVGSLGISGSTDGGSSFYGIVTIPVPADTLVWTSSYVWTIGSGWNSNQFVLKLYDYSQNSPAFDQSQPFLIAP